MKDIIANFILITSAGFHLKEVVKQVKTQFSCNSKTLQLFSARLVDTLAFYL